MALKSTIFKAALSITDMDRQYYETHNLVVARHPSETDERMMVRLLAFALHAQDRLEFTKGLCADEEPEVWQKSFSDEIELWIDLGLPSEKRIRQACAKADRVVIYAYGGRTVPPWWEKIKGGLGRFSNLEIFEVSPDNTKTMEQFVQRNMDLQITIQDGEVMIATEDKAETIVPIRLV